MSVHNTYPMPVLIYSDEILSNAWISKLKTKDTDITDITVSELNINEPDFNNIIATNITTTSLNATDVNITLSTITNIISGTISSNNITSTNMLTTNLDSYDFDVSNLHASSITTTNLQFTNLSLTNIEATNITSTNMITTDLTSTNANITNITATNLLDITSPTMDSNLLVSSFIQENGKFSISTTFTAYGDSFTVGIGSETGTNWPAMLATLSGKTAVNLAINGTTTVQITNTPSGLINNIVTNATYDTYSYTLAYGFNDMRNNNALFANASLYQWYLVYLNIVITMAMKQANIYDARTVWVRTGTWSNTTAYSFGLFTTTNLATLTRTLTGRYYMFSFTTINTSDPLNWTISMDGTAVNTCKYIFRAAAGIFNALCVVVDMQTSAARSVQVLNNSGGTTNQYFNYCCTWNSGSSFRPVLCCSIPTFNYDYTGAAPWDAPTMTRNLLYNNLIKTAVNSCQQMGLPVYFHQDSNIACFNGDNLHWSNGGYYQRASGINARL